MKKTTSIIDAFGRYLKLEKSLAANSVEAYLHDVRLFSQYLEIEGVIFENAKIDKQHIRNFLKHLTELGMSSSSQARILSGLKSFFSFMMEENLIANDPTSLIVTPQLGRKLPEILNVAEIEAMIQLIDLSSKNGERNKAIIEVLYGCG
ncbi:MAG: site-specific integrase, partial [Ignavibacteria bacterium]|nr:site-specific integrase [Ignavibacteria bacterium]